MKDAVILTNSVLVAIMFGQEGIITIDQSVQQNYA